MYVTCTSHVCHMHWHMYVTCTSHVCHMHWHMYVTCTGTCITYEDQPWPHFPVLWPLQSAGWNQLDPLEQLIERRNAQRGSTSTQKESTIHYNIVETHCYALQSGSSGSVYESRSHTVHLWVVYAAGKGLCGQNILQSVLDWFCYVFAHNQFANTIQYIRAIQRTWCRRTNQYDGALADWRECTVAPKGRRCVITSK